MLSSLWGISRDRSALVLAMATASAMLFVDETVLAVSLPTIQTDLGLSSAATQSLLLSYLIPFAAFLLPAGHAADVLGIRRVFLFGLFCFAIASIAAGTAQSWLWFCSARAVQGIGAAALAVVAPAAISQTCPVSERGKAMAFVSTLISLALVSGPVIGGALTQILSWRYIFFLNVPLAAYVLWTVSWAWRNVSFSRQRAAFDIVGSVLLVATIVVLSLALGALHAWQQHTSLTMALVAGGVGLAMLTLRNQLGRGDGVIDLGVLRERNLKACAVAIFLFQAAGIGLAIYGAFYFQHVRFDSPIVSGLLIIPAVLPAIFVSPIWGRIIDRAGPGWPGIAGGLVAACGLAIVGVGIESAKLVLLIVGFILYGFGTPAVYIATTTGATFAHPPDKQGEVSAILRCAFQMGSVAGVAILGMARFSTELDRLEQSLHGEIGAAMAKGVFETLESTGNTIVLASDRLPSETMVLALAAMMEGLAVVFFLAACLMLAAGVIIVMGFRQSAKTLK